MGENCWVPGCGSSRKIKGLYFHKLPCTTRKEDVEWRKKMEAMIKKYREVDKVLRERINKGNIYTCEKHYKVEDFEFTPTGRKKVKLYVVPSLNPTKSHETKTFPERPVRPREALPVKAKNTNCYENLKDLNKRLTKLKIGPWSYRICDDKTYIETRPCPLYPSTVLKLTSR